MTETFTVEIDSDLVSAADVEDVLARGGIKREAVDVSAADSLAKSDGNVDGGSE